MDTTDRVGPRDIVQPKSLYLAWRMPGEEVWRKVWLRPARNVHEPDPHLLRASDHIVIPEGAVVILMTDDDTPFGAT